MEKLMEKFKKKLRANNYKLTSQRRDILKVLIKKQNHHFNAEELFAEVKKINPDLGLATIYRNLELFCELGITNQMDFDNSYRYYELDSEGEHHHHLICVHCNKIIEFNDQVLEEFEEELEEEYDFNIINHRIKFYGVCEKCREKEL